MRSADNKIVHIVHCVDTEGPLYESLEATFERLNSVFGIKMENTQRNLEQLKKGEGVPPEQSALVKEFLSRLNYNPTWAEIDLMMSDMLSAKWRNQLSDDFGNGYIFNWFIMDHVGFIHNPRRRALGYHMIFEYYKAKLQQYGCKQDAMYWHFHPVSYTREANKCSNSFSFTNEHLQVLSRRVIDHNWFPAAYRPGQHTERPDINLFLEQWIPFDFGNQGVSKEKQALLNKQNDLIGGRFGDWRRATQEWEVYHPDFYDYQVPGGMKRYIARCLNLNGRLNALDEGEIEDAFKRADSGKETILAVTDHDEREMRPYIVNFYQLLRKIQKKYPGVKIKNSTAVDAMRETLDLKKEEPLKFDVQLTQNLLTVKTDKKCWGPQPYFCFRTKNKEYIHENLDYHGGTHWSFTFDENSIPLDQLDALGLATNDDYGNTTVWRNSL